MSFTQTFGGNTIYPSDISYLALSLTADTALQWPLEAAVGNNLVARIIDVTPSGAYSVFMPDATQTGVGQVTQFKNLGPSTITIKNYASGTLLSIAAGLTFTLYLTDNTTAAGTWNSFQAGASTAQAQASALAGYGLIAQGSVLSQSQTVALFNSNYTLGPTDRAQAYVWTGGVGTLTLPTASSVGNNWFVSVRNGGTGDLTVARQGSDQINGSASLVLRPADSAMLLTDGINFFTVGYGQQAVFAFDYTSIDQPLHPVRVAAEPRLLQVCRHVVVEHGDLRPGHDPAVLDRQRDDGRLVHAERRHEHASGSGYDQSWGAGHLLLRRDQRR